MRIYCENDYSDGHKSASTLDVDEFPEVDDEALDDYLHQFTGDGHGIGTKLGYYYTVTVLESEHAEQVGHVAEWMGR